MTTALVPELYVSDLEISLTFYVDLLGFEILYERPEDKFAYLRINGADLMLEQLGNRSWRVGDMQTPFGRGVNFQITIIGVEQVYKRCQLERATIRVPLENRTYRAGDQSISQTQFVVQDPDGYLIRLAEVQTL